MRTPRLCQTWQDSSKHPEPPWRAVESADVGKQAWARGTCFFSTTAALMVPRWTDCSPEGLRSQGSSRLLYTVSRLHRAADNIAFTEAEEGFLWGPPEIASPPSLVTNYGWKCKQQGIWLTVKVSIWQEVCSCQELFLFTSATDIYSLEAPSGLGIPADGRLLRMWRSLWPKFTRKLYSVIPWFTDKTYTTDGNLYLLGKARLHCSNKYSHSISGCYSLIVSFTLA